jgi:hypothetical protein
MAVRYIDGLQVAIVQCNPIRESLRLSHCPHCVHQYGVVLAEDQRRCDRVKAQRLAERPWPLADHSLSRRGKNVHAKRVRRGHPRGLFRPILAVHLVLLSTSEQGTVQAKIGRSTTTNPLDERIDQYQKYCLDVKVRNGHGYIPTGAARPAVGGNARKTKTGRDSFCWFSALKLLETGL